MVHDFSNKKPKKLYPDLKFIYISFHKKHIRRQIENVVSYMRDTTVQGVSEKTQPNYD